jgi:hypothetical protein
MKQSAAAACCQGQGPRMRCPSSAPAGATKCMRNCIGQVATGDLVLASTTKACAMAVRAMLVTACLFASRTTAAPIAQPAAMRPHAMLSCAHPCGAHPAPPAGTRSRCGAGPYGALPTCRAPAHHDASALAAARGGASRGAGSRQGHGL